MSTRSTTWFVSGDLEPEAKVYHHADGYPEGHGRDLQRFFADVEAQTADTRFGAVDEGRAFDRKYEHRSIVEEHLGETESVSPRGPLAA